MQVWLILNRRQLGLLVSLFLLLPLAYSLAVRAVLAAESATPATGQIRPLAGKVIVIDPGHGGSDPGAVGGQGVLEKTVVLAVAQHLRESIVQAGGTAVLTRDTDHDLGEYAVPGEATRRRAELAARVRLVTAHRADIFLSIHANKFGQGTRWRGAQVFWEPRGVAGSEQLAAALQAELQANTATRRVHRPIEQFILARSPVPAATVELGFLSNPQEETLLARPEYQRHLAKIILQGLVHYFNPASLPTPPAPGKVEPSAHMMRRQEQTATVVNPYPKFAVGGKCCTGISTMAGLT